jgi:hypothetical protein
MTRSDVITSLRELAVLLGSVASGTEWHLFGSVNRDNPDASDIDLMILCESDAQADMLRQAIDPDALLLPLHLSLFTFEEAAAIDVTSLQQSTVVLQLAPGIKAVPRTDA